MITNNKIEEIMTLIKKLNIVEFLELIQAAKEAFGISDDMLSAGPSGPSTAASATQEELIQNLVLTEALDTQKLAIIKGLRAFCAMPLAEAGSVFNDVLQGKKFVLKENLKSDEANTVLAEAVKAFGDAIKIKLVPVAS